MDRYTILRQNSNGEFYKLTNINDTWKGVSHRDALDRCIEAWVQRGGWRGFRGSATYLVVGPITAQIFDVEDAPVQRPWRTTRRFR